MPYGSVGGTPGLPAGESPGGDDTFSLSQHGKMVPYAGQSADTAQESLLGSLIRHQPGGDPYSMRKAVIKHRTL